MLTKQNDSKLPRHIAFIMDGNRRWAAKRGLDKMLGHKKGCDVLKDLVKWIQEKKDIKYASFFGFSTENWNRSEHEKRYLFNLFEELCDDYLKDADNRETKIVVMGDTTKFPKSLQEKLIKVVKISKNHKGLVINIGLNYGGRADIVHATNELVKAGEEITEENIKKHLYSCQSPDVDLLVRTSGEERLSNFMLYQLAYAELYFAKVCWPGFSKRQFEKALRAFSKRNRRFGGK